MTSAPFALPRMAEEPPRTLAMSISPAAMACTCWAPEVISGDSTVMPKGAKASSR
jgi:hypothetical protein